MKVHKTMILLLDLLKRQNKIAHIDKILYHWRERKELTALDPSAKPYIFEAAKKSKEDALCETWSQGQSGNGRYNVSI